MKSRGKGLEGNMRGKGASAVSNASNKGVNGNGGKHAYHQGKLGVYGGSNGSATKTKNPY